MSNLQTPNVQTGVAGADLSGHMHKFVAYDSAKRLVPCVSPTSAYAFGGPVGVCYTPVQAFRGTGYAILGNTDVFVANTVAPGDFLTANSVSLGTPVQSGQLAIAVSYQWQVPGGLARVEMIPPFRHVGNLP